MRATLRSIAKEANVSNVTVSNVLRGLPGQASEETRARVLEAARKLNYIPVKPPTSQNSRIETGVVGFVPERQEVGFSDLDLFTFQGIIEGARKHGYNVLSLLHQKSHHNVEHQDVHFLDRSSDGFIFVASMQDQWVRALDMLAEHRVPSVVCYRRNVPDGVAWACVDNAAAVRQATRHLVERGHTRIAYVAGPPNNFDATERHHAWIEVMGEYGLDNREHLIVPVRGDNHVPNYEAAASLGSLDVTAAVCFDDATALLVWDALDAQGLRVPDDISLVGINNNAHAQQRGLSSIAFSFVDVGRLAMDAWVELYNGGDAADCCKLAPIKLVTRNSVRTL